MLRQHPIKFLVDESVEYGVVVFLRDLGFNTYAITEQNPGVADKEVLHLAYQLGRVLITNDKGFSNLIFEEKQQSHGVILIRMPFATTDEKNLKLIQAINTKAKQLVGLFTTIKENKTRSKSLPKGNS